jgi:opacity protein-like surface antigen
MKAMRSLVVLAVLLVASRADADAYLRVIAMKASVRSGPSNGYREVAVVTRNQVFQVLERGTRDYWYKIELEDGTSGWILGDQVFPFEVGEEEKPGAFTRMGRAIRRAILGPSPVPYADVGLSFSAGLFENEGVFLLRPSWIIDSYWALEGHVGLSPRSDKSLYLGGLSFLLRMAPGAVITPYATLGVGAAHVVPKADNFVDMEETLMALGAGGGFEITFKKQITLRLDARNWTIFDQNVASNGQEYTGGLAIFF